MLCMQSGKGIGKRIRGFGLQVFWKVFRDIEMQSNSSPSTNRKVVTIMEASIQIIQRFEHLNKKSEDKG